MAMFSSGLANSALFANRGHKRKIVNEKGSARNQPRFEAEAMGVWNAWRHRKVGGFISAAVRSAGTSDAATVLRVSMDPSMRKSGQGGKPVGPGGSAVRSSTLAT
jgi:hypothetical protein